MVLEDAHWIDPTTLELFDLAVERVERLPVLLVVTFRPEFEPPWTGHAARHGARAQPPRPRQPRRPSWSGWPAGRPLPEPLLGQIVGEDRRGAAVRRGADQGRARVRPAAGGRRPLRLAGPLPPLAIPATLQDSLMARLDRLAPVKEVAQVGGGDRPRVLPRAPGRRRGPAGRASWPTALDQLAAAGLVFGRGVPPDATYIFKHALVQDAAYQSLLKSRRRQLHARIAEALEERFPEASPRPSPSCWPTT